MQLRYNSDMLWLS